MAEDKIKIDTPVGRVINHSLFEKDVFKDPKGREGTPKYNVQMAFGPDDLNDLEDAIVAAAVAEWGEGATDDYYDNGTIESPIKDGNEMAAKRAEKGKKGDAYEGMLIINPSTIFNKNGEDGPGGVYVCDEEAKEVGFAGRDKIYRGCYGLVNVSPSAWSLDRRRGVTLYLNGFQFVKDGDRLTGSDPSSLFKPMMGAASAAGGKGRRARKS